MASFNEANAALDEYRAALSNEVATSDSGPAVAFGSPATPRLRGAFSAFATPLENVHATGVGIRVRDGKPQAGDFVLKVYVYDKEDLGRHTPAITGKAFKGVGIDVEAMPVQRALATTPAQHRARRRPAAGGIQVSPAGASFVGTLGCIVRRGSQLFLLSNNHVLADTNQLALGTGIVQPIGPGPKDVIARLSAFEPIRFPSVQTPNPRNRLDAAVAAVTDPKLVQTGTMFGVPKYVPSLAAPRPGRAVTKAGRTTGVTKGLITAIRVNGVQVDYGTPQNPLIGTFDGCVEVIGQGGAAFSAPGDSGSVILDAQTGECVALLFAGDGVTTTACDVTAACTRFGVAPA